MALTDDSMVMPVQPAYSNYGGGIGFGGDWAWILLLLLIGGNGWGMGGFGGFGGGLGIDFPWLLNGQNGINANVNDGFRDAQLHDSVTSVRDGVSALATQLCGCCGDIQMGMANGFAGVQQSLCNGFAGTTAAINGAQNAISQQMYTNQIADLERSFAAQTAQTAGMTALQAQLAQCCCDNRAATADLKYTVATENCADRTAAMQNTRDIIDAQTRGTQAILDKLCALELDGVKGQLAQAQRENVGLQNQLNIATMQASQAAQTAVFQQGLNDEVDALYNRLKNCPVGTTPVYGNQPIFTCGGTGCGCGVA